MRLTFIGEDGSMGLTHGKTYTCKLYFSNGYIWVECEAFGIIRRCPYTSIRKMLENWKE